MVTRVQSCRCRQGREWETHLGSCASDQLPSQEEEPPQSDRGETGRLDAELPERHPDVEVLGPDVEDVDEVHPREVAVVVT